ncbi:MAG TPA: Rnase Y domain-containing protein, partial [Chitinophagaceae bacterium]|nr:Rnase Y domain-containing protein [Chitinophagaceae bacterium]
MDQNIISVIIGVVALIAGLIAGKLIFAKNTRKRLEEAEFQSQTILKEAGLRAENIRKEKELEVKEKA